MPEFYLNKVTIGANMGQSIGEPLHFGNFTGCAGNDPRHTRKRNSEENLYNRHYKRRQEHPEDKDVQCWASVDVQINDEGSC